MCTIYHTVYIYFTNFTGPGKINKTNIYVYHTWKIITETSTRRLEMK